MEAAGHAPAHEFESMFAMPNHLYRYRTAILVGPWRDSRLKAECDAVAAGQAEFGGASCGRLVWRAPGTIETADKGRLDGGPRG